MSRFGKSHPVAASACRRSTDSNGEGLMRIKALAAEFVGTFMLVASVLGAALFSFPIAGIVGVALVDRLLGHGDDLRRRLHLRRAFQSGGDARPRRRQALRGSEAPAYIAAQCLGGIAAALVFYLIASGKSGGFEVGNFASNMYGGDGYSMLSAFVIEVVLTGLFIFVIMGVTSDRAPGRLCRHRHRPHPVGHPPHGHSGRQRLGEPRPQPGNGLHRPGRAAGAALAVLGGADPRRRRSAACSAAGSSTTTTKT